MIGLPDKQYFKIGEVAKILGVKPSVLRYWETEFQTIRPKKTRSNHRLYTRRHVERIAFIRELLYEQKFTIAGARRHLRNETAGETRGAAPLAPPAVLAKIRQEVRELLKLASE